MCELKQRIANALKDACLPDPAPTIRLEESIGAPYRIGGVVLSTVFENIDPAQRQDRIWQKLDLALSLSERRTVSFILTETQVEYEVLRADDRAV
jgi:hypothetical protein